MQTNNLATDIPSWNIPLLYRDSTVTLEHRDAMPRPRSFDADALTIEAVIASTTPVRRTDARGTFWEVLDPAGLDLATTRGSSILDSHVRGGVASIIGAIDDVWVEGSEVIARIRFSERPEVASIIADVRSGIISFLSVGYEVSAWADSKNAKGERTRTATAWAAREASFVAVPADPQARTRGLDEPPLRNGDRASTNQSIRTLARQAGVSLTVADDLIDRGATFEEANMRILGDIITRGAVAIRSGGRDHNATSLDNPEVFQRAAAEALYCRILPSFQPSREARPFVGMSCADMARECLHRAGQATQGLSAPSLITRALQTSSDYPLLLANVLNKSLRDAYQIAPSGIRQIARETTANDFRKKSRIQFDHTGFQLEQVLESGEFKHGSFVDTAESYAVDTYGKIFSISRQALVNDDLGGFADVTRRLGLAAAEFERQFLANLLMTNAGLGPVMSDGKNLFDATHLNVAAVAAAPTEQTLSDGRLFMRSQTGPSGGLISVIPKYLIVPPELETESEKLITSIQATMTSDVNPFAFLELIVEPRLVSPTNRWYLAADPAYCPVSNMRIWLAHPARRPKPKSGSKSTA
jgi:phage head maturation protease